MLTQNQTLGKNNLNLVTTNDNGGKLVEDNFERWLSDLTQYERTLEEMAKASLQPSFKEELGAVETWFSELHEAERTATLYSLLHQTTNVQIRFFITILQKMGNDQLFHSESSTTTSPKQGLQTLSDLPQSAKLAVLHGNFNKGSESLNNSPNPPQQQSLKSQSYNQDDLAPLNSQIKNSNGRVVRKHSRSLSFNSKSLQVDLNTINSWPKPNQEDVMRPKTAGLHNNGQMNLTAERKNLKNLNIKVDNHTYDNNSYNGVSRPKTANILQVSYTPTTATSKLSPICWAATPTEITHPKLHSATSPPPSNHYKHLNDKELVKVVEPIDFHLLENVPNWMRSLRLHKYTNCFASLHWKTIVHLDDSKLEEIGVAALGARRKFLKTFEQILLEAKQLNIECTPPNHTKERSDLTSVKEELEETFHSTSSTTSESIASTP